MLKRIIDSYSVSELRKQVDKLTEQVCVPNKCLKDEIFNEEWGILKRLGDMNDYLHNPKWGIWKRLSDVNDGFSELKSGILKCLIELQNENKQLRERVEKLEQLHGRLDEIFIEALNKHLGNIKL